MPQDTTISAVGLWHLADMQVRAVYVRFRG
jgi:hypothetical protein